MPSKEGTEVERKARRDDAKAAALRYMAVGNVEMARQHFAKSVDVSPRMAARLIEAMRRKWGETRRQVDW